MRLDVKFVGANVIIKSLERFNKNIEKGMKKVLSESLDKIAKDAKNTIITENHVITGNLRDSLRYKLTLSNGIFDGVAGSLDTKVFYDIYVERLYPYLFPAYEAERPNLIRNLNNISRW
jgi:hypothetical protein